MTLRANAVLTQQKKGNPVRKAMSKDDKIIVFRQDGIKHIGYGGQYLDGNGKVAVWTNAESVTEQLALVRINPARISVVPDAYYVIGGTIYRRSDNKWWLMPDTHTAKAVAEELNRLYWDNLENA